MQEKLEWEMRIFKLMSIVVIFFALLTLKCALGHGNAEMILMRAQVPEMCYSLVSSLLILATELSIWYIFRVKQVKLKLIGGKTR